MTLEGPGTAQIRVTHWDAESKSFIATVSEPGTLMLRLFNYPAWRVSINGAPVSVLTRPVTGQMSIPVGSGENRVEIKFGRTWDRTLGLLVSLLSIFGMVFFWRWVSA